MIKNIEKEVEGIINWIREYVEKSKAKGVVIGNSGGKDCAAVIALATKALGKENVYAFEDKVDLIEKLKKHVGKNDLILVKASRGMKLEEVVQALCK